MVGTSQKVRDRIRLRGIPSISGVTIIMSGSGPPTDGSAGTGTVPEAARGSLYIDTVNARLYITTGTAAVGGNNNSWRYLDTTT